MLLAAKSSKLAVSRIDYAQDEERKMYITTRIPIVVKRPAGDPKLN